MLEEYNNYKILYNLGIYDSKYSLSFTIKDGLSKYIIDLGIISIPINDWIELLEAIKLDRGYELEVVNEDSYGSIKAKENKIHIAVKCEVMDNEYITYAKNFASVIQDLINELRKMKID